MNGDHNATISLYDLTRQELATLLATWGFSAYHAQQIWHYLYRRQVCTLDEMVDLRTDLRLRLRAETALNPLPVQFATDSSDGFTRKFLLRLLDEELIETVSMQFKGRTTACVSTQVGCAMGCVFCATGKMGFMRHLSAGEIVGQVMHIVRAQNESILPLRNIVLMGMGEPLHNYHATMKALDILCDHHGLAFAPRHITVSTVGVIPGIRRLADERRPYRLAVSLHGATDEERQRLVPPARRWPLKELLAACRYYCETTKRRIFFEWTLIDHENDTAEQAQALGSLLDGLDAHVNLIRLNPIEGYSGSASKTPRARAFQAVLAGRGIPSTIRQRRGIDIAAGCGQLRTAVNHG